MTFLTFDEYESQRKDLYSFLPELDAEEFKDLEAAAVMAVNNETGHFYRFNSLEAQPEVVQRIVKEATALTVGAFEATGVTDTTQLAAVKSVAIGSTSVTLGDSKNSQGLGLVPAEALNLLSLTGRRGGAVRYV